MKFDLIAIGSGAGMNVGNEDYFPLARAQTIYPALSEVVVNAFRSLRPANFQPHEHTHNHTPEHEHHY